MKKKVLLIFGTRPEAIKMAPLIKEFKERPKYFETIVCVTGQHNEMLYQVLDFFHIKPDYDLKIMRPNQTLFSVTADIMSKLEPVIDTERPDIVLVQGDTTSAFIGALAGFYKQIKVGHLEAGLRSGDIYSPFPEEVNRLLITKLTRFHFAPTTQARLNLLNEGVSKDAVFKVGNTVIDALLLGLKIIKSQKEEEFKKNLGGINWNKRIILVTGHRRESFGRGFEDMCEAIKRIALEYKDVEIVYPVHLNPNVQKPVNDLLKEINNIHLINPLEYPILIWLMNKAYIVLTDSGGIQEEAPTLGKPILVMRDKTERQEGIDAGTAKLVGTDAEKIYYETKTLLDNERVYAEMANAINPYGDGTTSRQIADILEKE